MTQHASLTAERWRRFSLDQQLLMVGNEMQRAMVSMNPGARSDLNACYARALRLVDLTVEVQTRRPLRRELLRWRDLVAALYIAPSPDPEAHRAAFRALLVLHPETYRQIEHLLG